MRTVSFVMLSDTFVSYWPALASRLGAEAKVVDTIDEAARSRGAAAVLLSVAGVEERGEEAVQEARAVGLEPVAVAGAAADHRLASRLVRAGAAEYFALPGDLEPLRVWLEACLERKTGDSQTVPDAGPETPAYDFSRVIGESPGLRLAIERAARVIAHGSAALLLSGEPGTGKKLLARVIHENGPRRDGPFVELDCCGIGPASVEAELFGCEAGAGAARPGLLEAAHGGTLVLQEPSLMPADAQSRLVRLLDEGVVLRMGSDRATPVDVRLVATTQTDLSRAVRDGVFRQDVFYRLNVVPIHLVPLRERGSDVVLLATHFAKEFARAHGAGRPVLDGKARASLLQYGWPGNVRELKNAVERAVLLGGGSLDLRNVLDPSSVPSRSSAIPFPATMDEIEHSAAVVMLDRMAGNKSAAAEALGISRSRLYRLLGLPSAARED